MDVRTPTDSSMEDYNPSNSSSYSDTVSSPSSPALSSIPGGSNLSYARSEGSCAMSRRDRWKSSMRSLQVGELKGVTDLIKNLLRQMHVASEARDNDHKANLQIRHENTTIETRKVLDVTSNVEGIAHTITKQIRDLETDYQKSMDDLQRRMTDALAENNMVIVQELQAAIMRSEAPDSTSSDTMAVIIKQMDVAQRRVDDLEAAHARMIGELQNLRSRLKGQRREQRENEAEYLEEVNRLRDTLGRKISQLQAAQEELSGSRTVNEPGKLARGDKVCDESLQQSWKVMAYEIRSVACILSQTKRSQYVHPKMPHLSGQADRYRSVLQDEDCESDILQTLIWRTVSEDILHGWSWKLEFHPQRMLQLIKQSSLSFCLGNEAAARKLGGWISDGTYYLLPGNDDAGNAKLIHSLSHEVYSNLIQMVDGPEKDEAAGQIHSSVQGICASAIGLQMMMLRSKAYFSIEWPKPMHDGCNPVSFDPSTMECSMSEDAPRYVLWCLTPIFWKHGNADGQHYDQKSVLAKARVICE